MSVFIAKNNSPPFAVENIFSDAYITTTTQGIIQTNIYLAYIVVREECLETLELRAEQDNIIGATLWIASVDSGDLSNLNWTKKLIFHDIQSPVGWWTKLIAYRWDIFLDEKFNEGYGKGRINIYTHSKSC